MISFCDYSFLFDLKAKICKEFFIKILFFNNWKFILVLLQYHAQLEMKDAIQNAFMHNFQTMMDARIEPVNPLLVLHINRNSIVQDTINQVELFRFFWKTKKKAEFWFLVG